MRQTLHVDGLLDEAPARGLWYAAQAQLHSLRQKVQTQRLPSAPREQRAQAGELASAGGVRRRKGAESPSTMRSPESERYQLPTVSKSMLDCTSTSVSSRGIKNREIFRDAIKN